MSILTSPTLQQMNQTLGALDFARPELDMVEQYLETQIDTPVRELSELGRHLLRAGGKRLRPALVILSAQVAHPEKYASLMNNGHGMRDRLVKIAACMELIHMASLVHDDVIDGTETRRGKPTANALYGNLATVLSGDYLLTRAMYHLAHDGDLNLIQKVAIITREMSEGEVAAVFLRNKIDISEEAYFEVLRRKTAVFLSGCCAIGAMLAQADAAVVRALEQFGLHIGMAFQVVDDLLDYVGDPALTGKAIGTDFREGCATLPLLRLYTQSDENERTRLRESFGTEIAPERLTEWIQQMQQTGCIDVAQEAARSHLQQALQSLETLPPSNAKSALLEVADFVVSRSK